MRNIRRRWPFRIDGWVVLPDHLRCIWTLPVGDADFTTHWRLIKAGFVKGLPKTEYRSRVRVSRGERGIWQRRFWEHAIRDEHDYPITWITCISIRSSMVMYVVLRIGRIQTLRDVSSGGFIPAIGRVAVMIRIGW